MFDVAKIEKNNWTAEIAPELGANVTKLKYDGKDVLVPLSDIKQLDVNPYIQGAPLLLPANRTAKGKFTFEGREYTLPITEPATGANLHGLLHRECFTVTELHDDCITLTCKNENKIYPFPFEITVFYGFFDEKFVQTYTVKNIGNGNMPLTFALHTSFVEPDIFTVPVNARHTKDENHIPYGAYDPLNEQELQYTVGSPSKGLVISGYYKSAGNTAIIGDFAYTVSDNFDHWILFNGAGKSNLLCVEPQCGKSNGLNTDDGKTVLAPSESVFFKTELYKIK